MMDIIWEFFCLEQEFMNWITFNNQKKSHYKSCSETYDCNADPRNIFSHLNNGVGTEVYTVTPDDYQNAGNCNGNCY